MLSCTLCDSRPCAKAALKYYIAAVLAILNVRLNADQNCYVSYAPLGHVNKLIQVAVRLVPMDS